MRWMFLVAIVLATFTAMWTDDAAAQTVQCLQDTNREARNRCAERELDDLRDAVRYWRRAAEQTDDEYLYFENARARCRGEPACIAREYQIEMSELQVKLEPARRARAATGWMGPVVAFDLSASADDLARTMDAVIMMDSRGWRWNSYDRGSVRNIAVSRDSDGFVTVHANYSYSGGRPGWVIARLANQEVSCLKFHDFPNECRPFGAGSYADREVLRFLGEQAFGFALQRLIPG